MSFSNREAFEANRASGTLYSIVKDGPGPVQGPGVFLNYGYQIALFLLVCLCVLAITALRNRWKWRTYIPFLAFTSGIGWSWNIYILQVDSLFPSWMMRPEGQVGPEFLQTFEDWVFYPVTATVFYSAYRFLQTRVKDFGHTRNGAAMALFGFFMTCFVFFTFFTGHCGKSLGIAFGLPTIALWLYSWKHINVKLFVFFLFFAVAFESIWDWIGASWLHRIPGLSWAVHWFYLSFDAAGNPHHSSVFLSYAHNPWAWIFDNPIEITPWFGILTTLPFVTIVTLDHLRCRKP